MKNWIFNVFKCIGDNIKNEKPFYKLLKDFITPFVIAIVGCVSTWLITNMQTQSAETIAASNRGIKALEIFSEKINSPDFNERINSINYLYAVEPKIAIKIAEAIIADSNQDKDVSKKAIEITTSILKDKNINEEIKQLSNQVIEKIINTYCDVYYGDLNLKRSQRDESSTNIKFVLEANKDKVLDILIKNIKTEPSEECYNYNMGVLYVLKNIGTWKGTKDQVDIIKNQYTTYWYKHPHNQFKDEYKKYVETIDENCIGFK